MLTKEAKVRILTKLADPRQTMISGRGHSGNLAFSDIKERRLANREDWYRRDGRVGLYNAPDRGRRFEQMEAANKLDYHRDESRVRARKRRMREWEEKQNWVKWYARDKQRKADLRRAEQIRAGVLKPTPQERAEADKLIKGSKGKPPFLVGDVKPETLGIRRIPAAKVKKQRQAGELK